MTFSDRPERERRLAIVLSGGGARGAYEVGVLWYICDQLASKRGKTPPIDILCGTSVGAINAVYLAAHHADALLGVRRLVDVWSGMRLDQVLGFGWKQMVSLPRVLIGGGQGSGVFDVSPMAAFVHKEIPWRGISRAIRHGQLKALSVSATEVSTGRTVLFLQTNEATALPKRAPPRTLIRAARIGPQHALASAAIPFLFPPVPIDGQLHVDGGVRQNTPIAPAIRLGASHLLVVGTSQLVRGVVPQVAGPVSAPSAAFLLGKVMNALLLDHLDNDLAMISLLNNVVESGNNAFGPDFVDRLNLAANQRHGSLVRPVSTMIVRPSEGIGRLAAEHIRHRRLATTGAIPRRLMQLLDVGHTDDADLASYLLFDGQFARHLIELGRSDAEARRHEISAFLDDAESSAPPSGQIVTRLENEFPGWSIPPLADS